MGFLLEPSIKNYKMWLHWWACQLDTPHWWAELTAIPEVEDPRKLAQKIHASFLIPAVRCEALQSQDYTMPPAPKCLTRGRCLPNDPSYQDVWLQPLLLTMAYAQVLQYWVEKVTLPTLYDYHTLVMSIMELKQCVDGHVTFSKHDVFQNLGSTTLEAKSWVTGIPQGDPTTLPTTTNVGDKEPSPTEAQGADNTTSSSLRCPSKDETPLAETTTSHAKADVTDTLPSPAETPPREDTMVLLAKADTETLKDLPTIGATSPAAVETQVVPTIRLVVELAAPSPFLTRQKKKDGGCWLWLLPWGGWIWKPLGLPPGTQWLPQSGEWLSGTPKWWWPSWDPLKGERQLAARMLP